MGVNFIKYSQYKNVDEVDLRHNKPENIDFARYNVVLHLAAIVHQSKKIPESQYYSVNRDLCLSVAEYAKKAGVQQFVFLSTLKVYGDRSPLSEIRNENSQCFPDDDYGKSKLEAESGLKKLEDEQFTVSVIRTPLVYGEGVKANMQSIIKLVDCFPLLPFKKVNNKRNFTYVENLTGYIDVIIDKKASGIFLVMDETAISTTELIMYLSKHLGKKLLLFRLPGFLIKAGSSLKPAVFERLYGSLEFENRQTRKLLGFDPPVSTDEGIRRMILHYKSQ